MSRDEILEICRAAARAAGIPDLLLVACGIAESNLDPNARRPKDPAKDSLYFPDVSGGLFQQTVRYDPAYRGGSEYPGPAEVERVLALQYDAARSAKVAAENLAQKWGMYKPDMLRALCAYNWPAGGGRPYSAAHEQNYRRGLAEAERLLADGDAGGGIRLSEVLARARSRIGDPYVWDGEKPDGFDCSGFVSWAYGGALPSFTDAILSPTVRVEKPSPGDIVLYEYKDDSQPGVRFPHVGLFLSDTVTLDARHGYGVGEHAPVAQATGGIGRRGGSDNVPFGVAPEPVSPTPPLRGTLTGRGSSWRETGPALGRADDLGLTAARTRIRCQHGDPMSTAPAIWAYRARVERVVDGDTLDVTIDQGLHTHRTERVRLLGVNTPERKGESRKAGDAATLFVNGWLGLDSDEWPLIVQTAKSDTFGRWLVRVWRADGRCLNDDLLMAGHAVAFMVD